MIIDVGVYWLGANLFLGLFNMLPFGPLDGLKVKDWNETAFYVVILIFAVPLLTYVPWLLDAHRVAVDRGGTGFKLDSVNQR